MLIGDDRTAEEIRQHLLSDCDLGLEVVTLEAGYLEPLMERCGDPVVARRVTAIRYHLREAMAQIEAFAR